MGQPTKKQMIDDIIKSLKKIDPSLAPLPDMWSTWIDEGKNLDDGLYTWEDYEKDGKDS